MFYRVQRLVDDGEYCVITELLFVIGLTVVKCISFYLMVMPINSSRPIALKTFSVHSY